VAKRRKTGVTKVPDRTSGIPLGREARMAVENLRLYGADPDCVPPLDDAEARKEWVQARSRPARNMPLWVADLAAAVGRQIPERQDRPRGRPRDAATDELRFWLTGGGSVAENAKLVETLRARREENPADNENLTDEQRKVTKIEMEATIATRAENLARRLYKRRGKRRKGDVPK
jgi:hypothetical protein